MKYLITLIALVMLMGCASLGPAFTEQEFDSSGDKALVYFYRPSRFFQGGGGPDVYINGIKEFRMHNGGYTYRYFPPGELVISPRNHFNWGLDVVEKAIGINAGNKYYIRMDFEDAGVAPVIVGNFGSAEISGVTVFNVVSSEIAEKEIAETNLIH